MIRWQDGLPLPVADSFIADQNPVRKHREIQDLKPHSTMTNTLKREMTITHADFFRILPKALKTNQYEVSENRVTIADTEKRLTIMLSPEASRSIGALQLPVTILEFRFDGYTTEQTEKFLRQFDMSFHKGGG